MLLKRFEIFISSVLFVGLAVALAAAADKIDMGGWQEDSAYNQLYDPAEMEQFKAVVVRIKEVVPMPGMSPGVAMEVREGKGGGGELIIVHLCPTWFAEVGDVGIKRNDQVKIKGVWAEIDGEDVFMASKVKKGDYFEFKVRLTKNGKPFWAMSPEELKKERTASQASLDQ
jgi:hypothetical protein